MQKRSLETRTRILQAATLLFARFGYDATGVAEICEAAGVSKGAFYHHFTSKQAIFMSLLDGWLALIDIQLTTVRQGTQNIPQALIKMSNLMRGVFESASGQLPIFLEFWTQASHDPAIWQAVIKPYHRYREYFKTMIQQGIEEGSLEPVDADVAARAIVSLALGLLLQGLLDQQETSWDLVTQQSIQYLLDGIKKTEVI